MKKNINNQTRNSFLSFCLLLSAFCFLPLSAFAQGGTTGPLTWKIENSILTISGTGTMPDYGLTWDPDDMRTTAPWGQSVRTITAVVIERGVANIGRNAFFSGQAITSIDISSSVTKIGENAFTYCDKLKSVVLPHSVTTIDECAFCDCGLISITLPSSIKSIGGSAFACYGLISVTNLNPIPLIIGSTVFYGDLSKCTLQVPKLSVAAYQRAPVWREFNIVGITLDIDELPITNEELRIYPNPSTGVCSITIPEELMYESSLILSVYDAAGVLVEQMELGNGAEDLSLKLDQKAKGIYVVVLSNGKKEYKGKVVFQ